MTMPNPVAEVVERLRDVGCDRMPFTDDHAKCVCRLTNKAADLIERLSRERDTGVPEGWREAVQRIRNTSMQQALAARVPECGHFGSIAQDADWLANEMAAAPQPPTVSTSRAHFEILAEAMSEIKATSDGHSDQPIADIVAWCLSQIGALPAKSDLFTVTRERDQAREALAELQTDLSGVVDNHLDKTEGWIGRELRAKDLPTWWHKVNDILEKSRARSVLHPEKEDNS